LGTGKGRSIAFNFGIHLKDSPYSRGYTPYYQKQVVRFLMELLAHGVEGGIKQTLIYYYLFRKDGSITRPEIKYFIPVFNHLFVK
jgi:uncharacterized membrane-anchored protein